MPQAIGIALLKIGFFAFELVAGAAAAATLGAGAAVAIGAAVVVGGTLIAKQAMSLFEVEMPTVDTDASRQRTVKSTTEPQKIIYGEALVSGPISFIGLSGTDNSDLYQTIVLAGHELNDITDIHMDDVVITDSQINGGSDAGGNVTAGTFGPKNSNTICVIKKHLGEASQTADVLLTGPFANYTSAHRGDGIAYLAMKWVLNEDSAETWEKFAPSNVKALVQGKSIYDPRLEFAAVGTRGQDTTNASYITYSTNPSLCVVDYLTDTYLGMGIAVGKIDWDSVSTAADGCDVSVSVPGGTESRFTCNGVVFATDSHQKNINKILSSMNGNLVYSNGKYIVHAGIYEAPTETLTEDDLIGAISIKTSLERSDRFNTIKGLFIDPAQNHKSSEFPKVQLADAVTRDNGEILEKEVQYPMTNSSYMAQRLSHKLIQLSDQQKVVTFPANLSALRITAGDRVQVSVEELNWSNKVFQCAGWTFSEDGGVNLTLREDSSTSYADPTVTPNNEYSTITATGDITDAFRGVPSPSGLTATAGLKSNELNWINPSKPNDFGTIYIYASRNANFSSAIKIGETDGTQFIHDASNKSLVFSPSVVNVGDTYTIRTLGNTNFVAMGAASNTVGVVFTATATGSGTGNLWETMAPGNLRYYWVRAVKNVGTDAASQSNLEPNADPNTTVFATVGAVEVDWDNVADPTIGIDINNSDEISINLGVANTTTGQAVAQSGISEDVTITQGGIRMNQGGSIRGGQTSYNSGEGFFLGYDSSKYKLSIRNSTSEALTFDGDDLTVTGTVNASAGEFSGQVAVGSTAGTITVIDGNDTDYRMFTNATLDTETNQYSPDDSSFKVGNDGRVFASNITIYNTSGDVLLSPTGLGAAALNDISVSSGSVVSTVGGTVNNSTSEITLTTASASESFSITSKVALNDNYDATQYFAGASTSSTASAEAQLTGVDVLVDYYVKPNGGSYSGTPSATQRVTIVNSGTPSSTQMRVGGFDRGAGYGGSLTRYFSVLQDFGGALEMIPNAGGGATSYVITTASLGSGLFPTAQTYKIKIVVRVVEDGTTTVISGSTTPPSSNNTTTGIYFDGGNSDERHYEITGSGLIKSSDNVFISGSQNLLSSGGTISGDLVVTGDLTVQGTTTTINVADLTVADKDITLNYSTGDSSATANNAGIIIQDAVNSTTDASILWKTATDTFEFSHAISTKNATFDNGTNTTVNVIADDDGMAQIRLYGSSQGTGKLFVGQSTDYGGGIEYNGDNSPVTSGAGDDYTALYRTTASTGQAGTFWTARNYVNSNDWEFRGNILANSNLYLRSSGGEAGIFLQDSSASNATAFKIYADVSLATSTLYIDYDPSVAGNNWAFVNNGNFLASGTIYADGAASNSLQWETGYDYSQIGHLPLAGGTLTGVTTVKPSTVTGAVVSSNVTLEVQATEGQIQVIADDGGDWASNIVLSNYTASTRRHYWIHNAPSTASANAGKFELRTSAATTAAQIGGQGTGSTALLVVDSSGNSTFSGSVSATSFELSGISVIDSSQNINAASISTSGITSTGDIVLTTTLGTSPAVTFNTSTATDPGVDMAIRLSGDELHFYEPEDTNKVHFKIYDDTGVDAPYGYWVNGTRMADVSRNLTVGTISSGAITSTGNSTHGGYSSWTGGSGVAGIFMHYNATNSYRSYFDWRTLQLGNNGSNNILAGSTSAGGHFRFFTNATAISQSGGTSGNLALTLEADADAVFGGNLYIPEYLYHTGNTGTNLQFTTDKAVITAAHTAVTAGAANNQKFEIGASSATTPVGFLFETINKDGTSASDKSLRMFMSETGVSGDANYPYKYGVSLVYEGSGSAPLDFDSGFTSTLGNGEWGTYGHENSVDGVLIVHSNRAGSFYKIKISGNDALSINSAKYLNLKNGIDIDNTDTVRVRFLRGGAFKSGIESATTAGDMVSTSAIDDLCIRSQESILFATGGNTKRLELDTSGNAVFSGTISSGAITAKSLTLTDDGSASPLLKISADDSSPWAIQLYREDLSGGPQVYASTASTFSFQGNIDIRSGYNLQSAGATIIDANKNFYAADFTATGFVKASASGTTPAAAKLHVGAINNAGSGAIAQFGGFVRASNYYILHASPGGSDAAFISYTGNDLDFTQGEGAYTGYVRASGLKIGSTTIVDSSRNLNSLGNIRTTADNAYLSMGVPGLGSSVGGRYLSIEGNTDTSGEGSGRIFFTEHNGTTALMDNYGMSIGYRGGATSIEGASGQTWTGLSQIGNGQWGMWGHDNSAAGALIMYGDRVASFVNFSGNALQGIGSLATTGNSTFGGYASWTAGNGTAGIFMHYTSTNSYRGYFDWRTLQLGNNGANNIIAGNTSTGGYFDFWVNGTSISQSGGTSGTKALTLTSAGHTIVRNNLTVEGETVFDSGVSTTVKIKCDNNGQAFVRANGDGQGTGIFEVGQSDTYGGGMSYNGDGSPAWASGERADFITFYRLYNGTRYAVFDYAVSNNNVSFNGSITASDNVTAYSDKRLKSDIKTLDGSKVLQMRGVSFTKDGKAGSGVIAQELELIASELVHTADDEMGTKSVAYGNLVGYLIENAKQQQTEIDELKTLVKKLMEK